MAAAALTALALAGWGLDSFDHPEAHPATRPPIATVAGPAGHAQRTKIAQEMHPVIVAEGVSYRAGPDTTIESVRAKDAAVHVALRQGFASWHVDRRSKKRLVVELGDGWVSGTEAAFRVSRVQMLGYVKHEVVVEGGTVTVFDGVRKSELRAGASHHFTIPREPAQAAELPRLDVEEKAQEPTARRPGAPREAAPRVDASALFEEGATAQQQEDFTRAASAYERLLRDFPTDPRATLTAFELGRLRMDRLSDHAGAVRALRRAVRGRSPFVEEALARLVRAHDAMGDDEGCRRARADYLARYPRGLYQKTITARCPPEAFPP